MLAKAVGDVSDAFQHVGIGLSLAAVLVLVPFLNCVEV